MLVSKIGPDRVLLNHVATRIDQTGDKPIVQFKNGVTIKAKKVIITIPPNITADLTFEPPLNHTKVNIKYFGLYVFFIDDWGLEKNCIQKYLVELICRSQNCIL